MATYIESSRCRNLALASTRSLQLVSDCMVCSQSGGELAVMQLVTLDLSVEGWFIEHKTRQSVASCAHVCVRILVAVLVLIPVLGGVVGNDRHTLHYVSLPLKRRYPLCCMSLRLGSCV